METVKIDAQKLQLLNDRINQTIDALNQVRLSTHGLQHTSGQIGVPQWGQPIQSQFAPGVLYSQGQAAQGLPFQAISQPGLEHSAPAFDPSMRQFALNSVRTPFSFGPMIGQGAFGPAISQGPQFLGQSPQAFGVPSMGISHTTPGIDPYWQQRAQMQVAYPQQYAVPQVPVC